MNEALSESDKNDNFLIVIGRQYGSGGRSLGRYIAKELGVTYYDKSLLSRAAERLGYSPRIFEHRDERRPSFFRSLLSFNYGAAVAHIDDAPMSEEKIYEFQSRVVRDICKNESCVIVGRTADYVMRDHPRMVSLFLHAPESHRAKTLVERGEAEDEEKARTLAKKMDHIRESYYNYYTNGNSWGNSSNYHLSADSSRVSKEALLAAIKSMLNL